MNQSALARMMAGVCLALAVPGQREASRLDRCLGAEPVARYQLAKQWREISGLAVTGDGRLLFHNDEVGSIGILDLASGRIQGSFALGPTLPRDDFEGIAVLGARLFLISSFGRLYETRVPAPTETKATLPFKRVDTGLGPVCEIEGLASNEATDELLIGCKTPRTKRLKGTVTIFRWAATRRALGTPDRITLDPAALAAGRPGRGFRTSGLEWDPRTGHFLLVAAADRAVAEVDGTGRVVATRALSGRHPQAEGIALGPKGELVISDEGGKGPGTITVYACR